jgi:hypothetical protein
VVFCFANPDDAEAFAKHFGGCTDEVLAAVPWRPILRARCGAARVRLIKWQMGASCFEMRVAIFTQDMSIP